MFLETSVLFALLITCVCSQTCENEAVEQFVKKKENATLEVITNLQNIVLQSSNSSFNGTHNQTTLYSTLTASFSLTESEETLEQFSKAIDIISDAYFKSCYGPEEEKPTVQDAPNLLQTFLTLLGNRTDFTTIREIYGKLTCLEVFQPDEIIVKREGEDDEVDLLECAKARSVQKLYECLDPKDLSCVFDIDIEQDCDDLEMIKGDISKYAKNCLAFVVDTTGSMSEEIVAARQVITSFILSEENILTLCYILVPFNDFGLLPIEDNLEYAKVYYADSLQEDDPFKVYDGQGNEQVVHGVADLLIDVNGLYADGGGDCPEYGMIAILKANELLNGIQSKQAKDGQHHIIVLTDASAKDDYLYQDVIGNITDESNVDVTVHFFFSGTGCPGFGNYSDIADATDGITVSHIDAASFPSFVEYIESFSDPDVETLSKRSVLTQCNSFIISVFVTSFSTLIKTSQPIVDITEPDGTLETLTTIGNSFVIYETSNPQPGEWSACVSSGTIEQSISVTVELDLSVEHVKLDAMGQLLPSTELPFACDMSIFTASTSKLSQISLNDTLYLDFVDNDRNILQYTEITECEGILSGSVILPSTPLKYQLRGYDIQGNPFSHLVSDLLITFEYPDFQISLIGSPIVVVNPGKQSLVRMSVQNTKKGPKNLVISATVTTTAGIGVKFVEDDVLLIPQTEIELSFYLIASDSVIEGQMLDLSFVVTDECTNVPTSMSFQAIVKTAIEFNVTDKTSKSLLFEWMPPNIPGNITSYTLSLDFVNRTITTIVFDESTISYLLESLVPYQLVYVGITAQADSNETAANAPIPIRTEESEPGQVSSLYVFIPSADSSIITWSEPEKPNGIILYYEITVRGKNYSELIILNTSTLSYTFTGLEDFVRYEAIVRAATSVGKGEINSIMFYTLEGAPISPPQDVEYIILSSTSIFITWSHPPLESRRGFISAYTLNVNDRIQEKIYEFCGITTQTNVTGLTEYSRVNVTISPHTSGGVGPNVTIEIVIVTGVPSAPRELAGEISNDTSVYLSWNFPEEPNGVLSSFHLFYGKTGSTKTEMGVIVPVTGNSYHNFAVHDLESEEEYYFKVAASNYAGMGENSTELVIMIPADTSEINALLIALPTVLGILFIVTIVTVVAILLAIWFRRRKDTTDSTKTKKSSNF